MRVPHSSRALPGFSDVPFDNDSPRGTTLSGEYKVAYLSRSSITWPTDFDDNTGVRGIGKVAAGRLNGGPELSDDFSASRNGEGVGNEVYAGIEENDLAAPVLVDDGLKSSGVISYTITLGSSSLDTLEFCIKSNISNSFR